MPVVISDEFLKQVGLSEREMLIEIACRLFDAEKLALWPAAQLAGLSRSEMEGELLERSCRFIATLTSTFSRTSST